MSKLSCLAINCLFLLSISGTVTATTVGVYGSSDALIDRIKKLGYTIVSLTSGSPITSGYLSELDVLFVASESAPSLGDKSSVIQEFVKNGGGLIVEQPNKEGPVTILPTDLAVKVCSAFYDGSDSGADPVRSVSLTEAGKDHPITIKLAAEDICQNADKVKRSDIGPQWTVLAVQQSNPDLVALAAGRYGSGRVVFETGNTRPDSMSPGSDLYLKSMIDWVAVDNS